MRRRSAVLFLLAGSILEGSEQLVPGQPREYVIAA